MLREDRYRQERKNPSFSSSLLDEIYRSTDDGAGKSPDLKFYRETINDNKTNKSSARTNKAIIGDEKISCLRRACLVDKWMDNKTSKKTDVKQRQFLKDQDAVFFSSTSSSSDSSSGGFSSSDADSLYGSRSRPKPVRTGIAAQPERVEKTERTLFYEQRELHLFEHNETDLIKSKSRALKIYSNLKKMKQPISPGGRLASFINSLFTTGNAKIKKMKNSSSVNESYDEVNTCSSASSFSRSCLSKNSPSTRERLRNGDKRSVRFYPISVIVDEDCRPCGHKCLYEKEDASASVATACKNGKSQSRKKKEDERVGEMARQFLKDYHQNQKKNYPIMRDFPVNYDHDDDDAASCSSSDLFELPVYETTHVETNRAIANGLIM